MRNYSKAQFINTVSAGSISGRFAVPFCCCMCCCDTGGLIRHYDLL
ncbi:MAG: hypothetical protein II059_04355 [Clostridia bacterium]|nr:hypothetical protein [Clostridia bacterium]